MVCGGSASYHHENIAPYLPALRKEAAPVPFACTLTSAARAAAHANKRGHERRDIRLVRTRTGPPRRGARRSLVVRC
jgi:hypothetical protein